MWCPDCRSEYRDEIFRCPACDATLVPREALGDLDLRRGPLTGRPIEEEVDATGPAIAGSFVTMEEAQSALRALSEEGITADVIQRDEQFPMTILQAEPSLAVAVPAGDLSRARQVLRNRGLLPVVIARFGREEDAHRAIALLEAKGLRPRMTGIVMEDLPAEFRSDMEPYVVEVPAAEEAAANDALEGTMLKVCENCGGQIYFGNVACPACGGRVVA
jgi:hypothetical protein